MNAAARRDQMELRLASTGRNRWWVGALGVAIGLLAAGSASSQINPVLAAQSKSSVATHATPFMVGVERRVRLADGRQLRLAADGVKLTLWDLAKKRLVRTHHLPSSRLGATLTLLPSGRVLIWGGVTDQGRLLQDGYWFEPELETLAPALRLALAPRANHSATVLTDGRVLFAGGRSEQRRSELWDERINRVVAIPAESADQRSHHRAELQSDGQVRLHGGVDPSGHPMRNALVFNPAKIEFAAEGRRTESLRTRAPALAASLPAQGATTVLPDARLVVRFTRPMKMTDFNASNVVLFGPAGATPIKIAPVEDGRLLFISPVQPLFPDSKYTLMVDGAHAVDGAPLSLITIDFRTVALGVQSDSSDPSVSVEQTAPISSTLPSTKANCGLANQSTMLCRHNGDLHDGVWTPGRDNAHERWRVSGPQPELQHTEIMALATKAIGFTTLMGRVVRVDGTPVPNVDISIGPQSVRTDSNGGFILYSAPSGQQEVYVDGTTANGPNLEYGQFVVGVNIKAGTLNQLPYTMYLPRVTARDKIRIPSPLTRDLVLKHPDMPGLMVQIPAGTVIRDRKGRLVRELAIVPTPVNRAPFPVAANYPMYFTLEPGGAVIQGLTPDAARGIRIFYPNYDRHPKGTQANFWIYDPTDGWRVYGKGRVTSDGQYFSPEAGVALHQTMGGSYSVSTTDQPTERGKPPTHEDCNCRKKGSGDGATGGDPIDLKTGYFSYDETDIAISDVMPISLSRHYSPRDVANRPFGIATQTNYGYRLFSDSSSYDLMELVLPSGVPLSFERTAGSGLSGSWAHTSSTTSFNGSTLTFVNDPQGHGFRLYLRDGSMMQFGNYNPNPLLWMQDRYGNRTELSYDAGFLSRITSQSGRYIQLEYDTNNRIHVARDSMGHAWTYDYNGDNLLSQVTYPDSTFKQYDYKLSHYETGELWQQAVRSVHDRRGKRILLNEFEDLGAGAFGRVIKQTLADNTFETLQYDHYDGVNTGVLVTRPDGSKRRVVFDPNLPYPASDTIGYGTPQAQIYSFERNGAGSVTARIDPLQRRTEYQYDGAGRLTLVNKLAGTTDAISTSASYNADGDLETLTDPLGHTTTLEYTNRCLTAVTDPRGKATTIICNTAGQPVSISDPLGHTTLLDYAGYDLAAINDSMGRTTTFRTDNLGRPIAVEDPHGNVLIREYEENGWIKKTFDALGRVTEFEYDNNGNLTAVLEPHGNGETYDYDDRNRVITRTDALNQAEHWTYLPMDRVDTYTDRKGQVTDVDYDVLGRPSLRTYQDGSSQTYGFDAGDRFRTLVDSLSGAMTWDYDSLDRLFQATSPQGTITYGYDDAGRRTSMTAASQPQVTYDYDEANRPYRILQGSEVVQFDYDDANRLIQTTLPNGIKAGYAYNDANQLTGLAWLKPDANPLGDLGNGYDDRGQLMAQTGSFASQNLPAVSTGTNTFDDNHRQTQYNGQTLTYDPNGNLTGDGTRTYVWNARNQLTSIKQGTSTLASFAYDAFGRRTGRTESGQTTGYLYDGMNAVQEMQGSTVNPILTGLGIDQRFARNDNGGRTYFLTDLLGSTRALTNAAGAVVQRYDYTPYGETSQTASGFSNPYQYTGRERDGSGLYYYRARYYQPGMGRFISEDPIGLAGGLNTYAYVGGNPISRIDPLGLADYLTYNGSTLNGYVTLPPPFDSSLSGLGTRRMQEFSVPATSGPWGDGRLPAGTYGGRNLRRRSDKAMSCPDGNGWSLDLDDKGGRSLLRIHPDGNVPGTLGCVGVVCGYQNQVFDSLSSGLTGGDITLDVNYGDDP